MPIPATALANWYKMNPAVLLKKYRSSRWTEVLPEGIKNQLGGSKWGKSSAFDRMRGKNTDDGESGKVSQQSGTYYNSGADVAKSAPSYLPPKGIPPKVKNMCRLLILQRVIHLI